jgi:hypothetical protein
MKILFRKWFWSFMGYASGPPVNTADMDRILGSWHARVAEDVRKQSVENQARMLEWLNQWSAKQDASEKVINVRIVK